jgi:hypothetical protein
MLAHPNAALCAQAPHLLTVQHSGNSCSSYAVQRQLQPSPYQALFCTQQQSQQLQMQAEHIPGSTLEASAVNAAAAKSTPGTSSSTPQGSILGIDIQTSGSLCGTDSSGSAATPSSRPLLAAAFGATGNIGGNAGLQQQQQQQQKLAHFAAERQQQMHMLGNAACVRIQPATAQQHVLLATHSFSAAMQTQQLQQLVLLQPLMQQQMLLAPAAAATAGSAFGSSSSSNASPQQQQQQVMDFKNLLNSSALSANARREFEDQLHEAYNAGYGAGFSDGVEAGRQQKRWR